MPVLVQLDKLAKAQELNKDEEQARQELLVLRRKDGQQELNR